MYIYMYLFPCFLDRKCFLFDSKAYTLLLFILMKYYVLLYLIGFSNSICVITCTYVMCHSNSIYLCVILKIQMVAPDDNLNDDIMVNIINIDTNVDDTSQYFADYDDILNMPVVEDQQIVTQENTGEIYIRLSIISYRCMRTYICC